MLACPDVPSALSPTSLLLTLRVPFYVSRSPYHLLVHQLPNDSLDIYKKRTKHDLLVLPFAAQLKSCDPPRAILDVLQQRFQDLSQSIGDRWLRWLNPTVNVLHALSSIFGAGVDLLRLKRLRYTLSYSSDRYSRASKRNIFRDRRPPFSAKFSAYL